jgi:hypothetical protein
VVSGPDIPKCLGMEFTGPLLSFESNSSQKASMDFRLYA